MTSLTARVNAWERLTRLDRPIGTLLLLWPTLQALWIASGGWPTVTEVIVFSVGTLLMRSAGCAVNDVVDRHLDGRVKRTEGRPLVTGEIGVPEALAVAAVLALAAFGLVLFLNRYAILLSFAALAVAIVYPFTKRFLAMPQAVLGIAFAFGIPMAFAAVQNRLGLTTAWLFAATFFWIIAYDTEYAMVDRDDDLKAGIRSSAILFGRHDVLAVMLCYATMLILLFTLGRQLSLRWPFNLSLAIAAILMLRHWLWIRGRERDACFRAFLDNHWVGLVIFSGIVLSYFDSRRLASLFQ
jgi:4-hydroxybenzoate polyprenyltransferase